MFENELWWPNRRPPPEGRAATLADLRERRRVLEAHLAELNERIRAYDRQRGGEGERAGTRAVRSVTEEHEQFAPLVRDIREVAESVGHAPVEQLLGRMEGIHGSLSRRLIPHAVAEGRSMLPLVRKLPGGPEAAVQMNQCHVQLDRLTDELQVIVNRGRRTGMDAERESESRRILYGIHALLTAHFAQAEEMFAAAIEDKNGSERERLFASVERSAQDLSDIDAGRWHWGDWAESR